jgi:hypothetical protein
MSNTPTCLSEVAPYIRQWLNTDSLAALNEGLSLLLRFRRADPAGYRAEHKGAHFYWLGVAAFMTHDYQTAAFFFDAAVSEDIAGGSDPTKSETPALKFAYIRGDEPEQAARVLVKDLERRVNIAIDGYNSRPDRLAVTPQLGIDDIRRSLIRYSLASGKIHLRTLATAFISFFLEWEHRSTLASLGLRDGTVEPFFIHLFKGCLLFESLLKENPKKRLHSNSLGQILRKELHFELGVPTTIDVRSKSFASILGSAQPSCSTALAIERAGRIRNTLGHNFGWPMPIPFDEQIYGSLVQDVASSCLHAINCLYK